MDHTQILSALCAIGSALMAGTFFAFSTFIMPALAQVERGEGMRAMQRINVTVFHPLFMGTFMGTALVSLALLVVPFLSGILDPNAATRIGALTYIAGVFVVTAAGNVPLNNRLEGADSAEEAGLAVWDAYQRPWVRWNHLRTVANLVALGAFAHGALVAG